MKPLGQRILVRMLEPKLETKSGLLMTSDMIKYNTGLVLAVGTKVTVDVKEGDEIIFLKMSGIQSNKKDQLFVMQGDCLAKIGD